MYYDHNQAIYKMRLIFILIVSSVIGFTYAKRSPKKFKQSGGFYVMISKNK